MCRGIFSFFLKTKTKGEATRNLNISPRNFENPVMQIFSFLAIIVFFVLLVIIFLVDDCLFVFSSSFFSSICILSYVLVVFYDFIFFLIFSFLIFSVNFSIFYYFLSFSTILLFLLKTGGFNTPDFSPTVFNSKNSRLSEERKTAGFSLRIAPSSEFLLYFIFFQNYSQHYSHHF